MSKVTYSNKNDEFVMSYDRLRPKRIYIKAKEYNVFSETNEFLADLTLHLKPILCYMIEIIRLEIFK